MGSFGQLTVCVATVLSAMGGALALAGGRRPRMLDAGEKLLHAASAAALASLAVLVFLLLTHDLRIAYVHDYADRTMSTTYLVMAVWGGQQGSLLLWAVLQCWFTSAVALFRARGARELAPVALGFLAALQVFFLGLVLFHSDPFEALGTVALEGVGMNPLLRNPYMAIHPPTLFLGFVGFSVPMAFAVAALAEGKLDDRWLASIRPFVLFAWIFLSVGNLLGMVWAYEELGWGGYWGWDPVENASFMPWLTGTALVHTAMALRLRRALRIASVILVVVTFSLIIFGTFLTRSGIIASVHSFAGATTGPYLLGLIVASVVGFAVLALLRRRGLRGSRAMEGALTPEGVFLLVTWVFVVCTAFVWFATMAPLFAELIKGEKIAVPPEFYNRWMAPLGLALLALLALGTIVRWRTPSPRELARRSAAPGVVGALAGLALAIAVKPSKETALPIAAAFLVGFVVAAVARELAGVVSRLAARRGSLPALRRRLGGQIVHLSVALLFAGFTGSAFTEERSANLGVGESMRLGDYSLTLLGLRQDNNYERRALKADLEVQRDGAPLGVFSPSRHNYHSHPNQPTSEVVIRSGLEEDLFLIFGEGDPLRGRAVIRAVVNPMVAWIWIGGALLVLGTLIALVPAGWIGALGALDGAGKRRLVEVGGVLFVTLATTISVGLTRGLAASVVAAAGLALIGMVALAGQAAFTLARNEGDS